MPVRVLCWTRNAVFLEPRWNMDQYVQKVLLSGRCPKFSGLLLRENTCGTNVARLRISVWFVGKQVSIAKQQSPHLKEHCRRKAIHFHGLSKLLVT